LGGRGIKILLKKFRKTFSKIFLREKRTLEDGKRNHPIFMLFTGPNPIPQSQSFSVHYPSPKPTPPQTNKYRKFRIIFVYENNISREANKAAHSLAALAHIEPNKVWLEETHPSLVTMLFFDLFH
jgi:hypothetical protein